MTILYKTRSDLRYLCLIAHGIKCLCLIQPSLTLIRSSHLTFSLSYSFSRGYGELISFLLTKTFYKGFFKKCKYDNISPYINFLQPLPIALKTSKFWRITSKAPGSLIAFVSVSLGNLSSIFTSFLEEEPKTRPYVVFYGIRSSRFFLLVLSLINTISNLLSIFGISSNKCFLLD